MTNKTPFEAVPQIVARLEEKLDALTETVTKLFQRLYTPPPEDPEEMVAITEAANILHLSVSRVRALVQEGRVPCYKPGRNLLFLPSELRRWLSDSKRRGQSSIEEQMAMMTKVCAIAQKEGGFHEQIQASIRKEGYCRHLLPDLLLQ